jgi:PAS domain S-box-containing protein
MDSTVSFKQYRFANTMLEYTAAGMAIFDARDLRLLEANAPYVNFVATIRRPQDEPPFAPGASLLDCQDSEGARRTVSICREVIASKQPHYEKEEMNVNALGETTYWNWTLAPILDEQGNVTHIVQTLNDVTAQVEARQQAEEAQQQLRHANEVLEKERKRLEVVEAVARCVRETLNSARIGQIAMEIIETHFDTITSCIHTAHPEQRVFRLLCASRPHGLVSEGLKSMDYMPYEQLGLTRGVLTQREPIVVEDLQIAAEQGKLNRQSPLVRLGTRGYVCVPLWFGDQLEGTIVASFGSPVSCEGPEVHALVGMGTHIAAALAHARLHATIEKERTRLRAVLDQLPEGILIAETSGGAISYANPAATQILGISTEEITRIPLHRHSWLRSGIETTREGRPLPPWNFIAIRALSGETFTGKEATVMQPDGRRIVTLASCAPLYSERGLMTGAVIVLQDVTAQKTLEQHKNEFFSIANHELRTPITVIQGFSEILQLRASQENSFDKLTLYALTNIVEQSHHLTHLIEEMLDISRIEQTQFKLDYAPCNLLSLLKRVVDGQSSVSRLHKFIFQLEGVQETDIVPAYLDEQRMVQVFNNLIGNAIKYSARGSTIEIGLKHVVERPQEVLIWVKDEGIGIAAEDIPHIFKRFHRARNVDRSHSGFGIGLYLVKEVVTQHRGRVWVDSCEGEGSTFYVTLPLAVSI